MSHTTPHTRAIIHVFTAARDRNGNCYHAVRVTNTATGAFVEAHTDAEGNPTAFLRDVLDWSEMYRIQEVLPIRAWQAGPGKFPFLRNEREAYRALFQEV